MSSGNEAGVSILYGTMRYANTETSVSASAKKLVQSGSRIRAEDDLKETWLPLHTLVKQPGAGGSVSKVGVDSDLADAGVHNTLYKASVPLTAAYIIKVTVSCRYLTGKYGGYTFYLIPSPQEGVAIVNVSLPRNAACIYSGAAQPFPVASGQMVVMDDVDSCSRILHMKDTGEATSRMFSNADDFVNVVRTSVGKIYVDSAVGLAVTESGVVSLSVPRRTRRVFINKEGQ